MRLLLLNINYLQYMKSIKFNHNFSNFAHPTPWGNRFTAQERRKLLNLAPQNTTWGAKTMLCVFAFAFMEVLEKVGHGVVGYYIAGGT